MSPAWAVAIAVVVVVLVAAPFLLVGPFAVFGHKSPREILKDQPHEYLQDLSVPEFLLTSQDGEPVSASVFDGRFTVVDFIFTNCPLACPVMFSNLIPLHNEIRDESVHFLSISVDPVNDTPEVLRDFADRLDLDTSRWTLAASDEQTLRSILAALNFTINNDPGLVIPIADGGSMQNIVHPTRIVLIGPDRSVIGLYKSQEYESVQELRRDLRALLRAR